MIILRQKEFSKIGDWIKGETKSDKSRINRLTKKLYEKDKKYYYDRLKNVDPENEDTVNKLLDGLLMSRKNSKNKAKLINNAGKMAMVAIPATALLGTGMAMAIKNHINKKKNLDKSNQETDKD